MSLSLGDTSETPPSAVRGVTKGAGSQRTRKGKKVIMIFDPVLRQFYLPVRRAQGEKIKKGDSHGDTIVE